jgi:hypothetical protein
MSKMYRCHEIISQANQIIVTGNVNLYLNGQLELSFENML